VSYSIRHQIFVSSTFVDLKEERAEVIQAVWELDCIPTGMEAFVASNESQWDVIKRVIEECDYYVLIIGGRYGSLAEDGISYTEKEYRYARKIGLPVLAFVHAAPDDIPLGRSERDDQLRSKLAAFRNEVMAAYPVRKWLTATELGGAVSRSLIREIKITPRPGWIRNDGSSPIALLEQINRLTEENRNLRAAAEASIIDDVDDGLESGSDEVEIGGKRQIRHTSNITLKTEEWKVITTWDGIWRQIGPLLINESSEDDMTKAISELQIEHDAPDKYVALTDGLILWIDVWNNILIQFRALGFIESGTKKRGVNDRLSYWKITPRGDRHLLSLLARRKSPLDPDAILG